MNFVFSTYNAYANFLSPNFLSKNRKILLFLKKTIIGQSPFLKFPFCKPKNPFNTTFNSNLNEKTVFTNIFHILD